MFFYWGANFSLDHTSKLPEFPQEVSGTVRIRIPEDAAPVLCVSWYQLLRANFGFDRLHQLLKPDRYSVSITNVS